MSAWVHLDVEEILAETQKAFLLQLEDCQVWVPFSQIDDAEVYEKGDKDCVISVAEWFAKKEGLA